MIKKFATGLASASLLLASVVPVFAAHDITIEGNGSGSDNTVTVRHNCTQKVVQKNKTNVTVDLKVTGNTGKNRANANTGGDTSINTGDVTNDVVVGVVGGGNSAEVPECCCSGSGNGEIAIVDNGNNSTNEVDARSRNRSVLKQKSKTRVTVNGTVRGNTGKNRTNNNTGGDQEIDTGDVENTVEVGVEGGSNEL